VEITPITGYNFAWSNGDNLAYADSLCAGTYSCTISDSEGIALDTINVEVAVPSGNNYQINVIDASCPGAYNGAISITPLLAVPPYSYFVGKNDSDFAYAIDSISVFTGLDTGDYTLVLIDGNGCKETLNTYLGELSNVCTGITDETNRFNLNVYPNPVAHKLEIELQGIASNSLNFSIVDISGQILSWQTINPIAKTEIDVSSLAAGMYFIQFQDGQQSWLRKFVKE